MDIKVEDLYKLVDAVPQSEWDDVKKYLKIKALPTDDATESELEAFRLADIDKENGDLVSLEDFRRELLGE